jgi:hypothetical protein
MEGSVLSFLKAEWKVSDTGSAHWASRLFTYHDTIETQYIYISHVKRPFFHIQLASFSFCLSITYNLLLKSK